MYGVNLDSRIFICWYVWQVLVVIGNCKFLFFSLAGFKTGYQNKYVKVRCFA